MRGSDPAQSGARERGSSRIGPPRSARANGDAPASAAAHRLNGMLPAPENLRPAAAVTREGVADPAQSRLHYLEALVEASRAISGTLDPGSVAELLLDKTRELLGVAAASVMLVDNRNRVRITAAQGLSEEYIATEGGPLEQTIAGRALAEGRTFASWDLRQADDERLAAAAAAEGIISGACAPMFFGSKPVGALNIYCRAPRCFTQDQFYVLSLLASHGAVALSNARSYKQLRAQAAEVRASFQRVGAALSASLDLGETLRLIVHLAGEMIRATGGALYLIQNEEEGGGMLLSAASGLDRRSVRRFRRPRIEGLARQALDTRHVVVVPETRRRPDIAFPTLRDDDDTEPAEVRSALCVPVFVGERPVAVLEQYAAAPGAFDRQDIQLLSSFAHQASVAIENARLYAQERGVAQTLQRAFLPELPQTISGFQIGRIYAPGSQVAAVGGDMYDLFTLDDGRIAALIADVSGQGTYAATLAVMAKYTVRSYALEDPHPSVVMRRVNDALVHQTGDSTFLTLCYALIDPRTRQVTLARAAHPPAILCHVAERRCELLDQASGLIAGFLPGQEYDAQEVRLESEDVLVFYTDGVTEARRRKVMFGERRLQRVISENAHQSAQEIAAAIYTAISEHTEDSLNDDVALLVLKAE